MANQTINRPEGGKKQLPLRLSESLFKEISRWAEEDFRSVNGQIEYLLTQCVRQKRKNGAPVPDGFEAESDIETGEE